MGKIIGIDLGTTNSVVAVMEGSEVKVIANPLGFRTTPSVVAFKDDDERIIGQSARNQAVTNPENTIYSIKRFIGRRRSEVKSEEKLVPYKITGAASDVVKVEVEGKPYAPPEISAMVLRYMKDYAQDYLGEEVKEAVITVPAYFNDAQRQATKDAGEIAGLKVLRIINEPTAAALAYSLDKKRDERILVFDLGGGTFDVSVLEVDGDGTVEVKATRGDMHLGGDDYDQALIDFLSDEFAKKNKGVDLRKDRLALGRLKEAAEKAKCELSSQLKAQINLPFITQVDGQGVHFTFELTRAQFENVTANLTDRCRKPVELALADAKLSPEQIDEVVLVGGSTRIPAVQDLVKSMFAGKEPNKSVNPDEVVAIGAAIQGAVLSGEKTGVLLLDVTSLSLGIETLGGPMEVIVPRNTTIPTTQKKLFTTAEDDQRAVDIKVFQGDRKMTKDNRHLGTFRLDGIPPARKGDPKIEVTFDVDANGILSVTARDIGTKREQRVTIETGSGLSKDDIERMKREAEEFAAEDERRVELVGVQNKADDVIFKTERSLRGAIGLSDAAKKAVAEKIELLRTARNGDDPEAIEKAIQEVYSANSATMYGSTGGQKQESPPSEGDEGASETPAAEAGSTNEPPSETADEDAEAPADFGNVAS